MQSLRDQRGRKVRHANMSSARGNDRSLRTYELYAVLYSTQKRIRKRGNIPERSTLFFLKSHLEWRKLVLGLGDGVEEGGGSGQNEWGSPPPLLGTFYFCREGN